MLRARRVGLIGPRRRRQGLGPFVARHLRDAGAEVVCILGTSAATVAEAERDLGRRLGTQPRGYVRLEEMLASEALDALVILSPAESHERYLGESLAAGLHCLCEKPLVWGGRDPAAAARRLVDAFERAGLRLWENCQWPYLLDAFEQLHPGVLRKSPSRFEMGLSPASRGVAMLVDSLSHPLSVLQAIAPAEKPRLEAVRFAREAAGARARLNFTWRADAGEVEAEVRLEQQQKPPRAGEFSIDRCRATREIREPGYRLFLRSEARAVPAPDPTARLVSDFVRALEGEPVAPVPASSAQALVQRMELLTEFAALCGSP